MSYFLCGRCISLGFCCRLTVNLASDRNLDNPEYIRDVRMFAFSLSIKASRWHEHLTNLYRDYRGRVLGLDEREVSLDMDEFEVPHVREWFRDFCCTPCPEETIPRLRRESKERVRNLATILAAHYPERALLWGVRPSNDNRPPGNPDR